MVRRLSTENQEKLSGYSFRGRETSYLGLRPGDVIQFGYMGSLRLGVVVASRRTSSGIFLSSRSVLMNVVLLEGLSEGMFTILVNNLYNNDYVSDYRNLPTIRGFVKSHNFRTFKVGYMSDIITVSLDTSRGNLRTY